jgi:hypothetical protein
VLAIARSSSLCIHTSTLDIFGIVLSLTNFPPRPTFPFRGRHSPHIYDRPRSSRALNTHDSVLSECSFPMSDYDLALSCARRHRPTKWQISISNSDFDFDSDTSGLYETPQSHRTLGPHFGISFSDAHSFHLSPFNPLDLSLYSLQTYYSVEFSFPLYQFCISMLASRFTGPRLMKSHGAFQTASECMLSSQCAPLDPFHWW